MRILGIAGSLRRGSHNRKLLRAAGAALPPGAAFVEWDGLGGLPIFDEDLELTPPPAAHEFLTAIEEADAVIIATPEYNASLPGGLKNALDWASRPLATNPLRNVPVAVVGASNGAFGAVWAQAETRKVLAAMGARVVGEEVPVGRASARLADDGRLLDDELEERVRDLLDELVAAVEERTALAA